MVPFKNMDGKKKYIFSKTARYLFIFYLIISLNFLIPHLMPGDPVDYIIGEGGIAQATAEDYEAIYASLGLDRPLHVQYFDYLERIIVLDFGYTYISHISINEILKRNLRWTFLLVVPSVFLSAAFSLFFGCVAGFNSDGKTDKIIVSVAILVYTLPSFLIGLVALSALGFHLDIFPLGHLTSGGKEGIDYWIDVAYHLILPVIVLSVSSAAYKSLVVRSAVTQIKDEYFVFVAKAKGLSKKKIIFTHIMRNIMPQFISIVALSFGNVVSGAIIIEIVFSINGMGMLIHDSVLKREYPVLQACFLILTLTVLACNFIADMLYGIVDPRVGDAMKESIDN
ncbi:ABC transporter permease [uncultured Methanolobus sp.]|uniref:ABC transporter permease n=1 Tax=uncultured Methanolobus sp. TaxID=218300 RepID=UPI0029C8299B|nr:ABC transporter permease [uncultured Methanolobus sp.]